MPPVLVIHRPQQGRPDVQEEIRLSDAALPRRLPYEIMQRFRKTSYVGNLGQTGQSLGPMFQPQTWQGQWYSPHLRRRSRRTSQLGTSTRTAIAPFEIRRAGPDGNTQTFRIPDAMGALRVFERMVKLGTEVTVQWSELAWRGTFTRMRTDIREVGYIEYEITFEPLSDAISLSPDAATVLPRGSVRDASDDVTAERNRLRAVASRAGRLGAGALASLNDRIQDVDQAVDGLSRNARSVVSRALAPLETARNAIGLLGAVRAASFNLQQDIARSVSEARLFGQDIDRIRAMSWGDHLGAGWRSEIISARARRMEAVALEHESAIERDLQPEVLTEHTLSRGESLPSLARRYYGTPTLWYEIAQFAGIEREDQLVVGRVVPIPVLAVPTT